MASKNCTDVRAPVKVFPGDPWNAEPNKHPLTHDLLSRLGAFHGIEDQGLSEKTGYMNRLGSSDGNAVSVLYSIVPWRFANSSWHQRPCLSMLITV